jgi:hypothetical protein
MNIHSASIVLVDEFVKKKGTRESWKKEGDEEKGDGFFSSGPFSVVK